MSNNSRGDGRPTGSFDRPRNPSVALCAAVGKIISSSNPHCLDQPFEWGSDSYPISGKVLVRGQTGGANGRCTGHYGPSGCWLVFHAYYRWSCRMDCGNGRGIPPWNIDE